MQVSLVRCACDSTENFSRNRQHESLEGVIRTETLREGWSRIAEAQREHAQGQTRVTLI